MLISKWLVAGSWATAFARRVDGFRSAETTNICFEYFFATARYAASDPARGDAGLPGPGRAVACVAVWGGGGGAGAGVRGCRSASGAPPPGGQGGASAGDRGRRAPPVH